MKVDLEILEGLHGRGLISCQTHPTHPLYIFNYTPKVQFDRLWDEHTLMCRGLITTYGGEVIARPFGKFFNLDEHQPSEIPAGPFEVYEKLDGSLGILYWVDGVAEIATRGSFSSPQALFATDLLHQKYAHVLPELDQSATYLFEIIYPENRIAVDYADRQELVLLSIIDTNTGKDRPLTDVGFPLAKRYDGIGDYRALKSLDWQNSEGFVIKFENDFRVKVKFNEYVRLHRIVTGISNLAIWEYLSKGESIDSLLESVPDEFYQWVKSTCADLEGQYSAIEQACQSAFVELPTRKECALAYQQHKHPAVLFKMLDRQPYDNLIWKAIRPKYSRAFKVDIDK